MFVDQKLLLIFVDRLFYDLMSIDLSVYLSLRAIGKGSAIALSLTIVHQI
jgi:hypothetical protein